MGAKYIYRMDDITPEMNWKQFWKYIALFKKHDVKPLLGIVPDNKDPKLVIEKKNKDFWEIIRDLQLKEIVEISQHGYQHNVSYTKSKGMLGRKYGFNDLSEFTGLPYEVQFEKIKAGRDILQSKGIYTDIWMAPCHSFDEVTLEVLVDLGFTFVTDGIALYPLKFNNLVFVPQQLWRPRYFPFGIVTICLHTNSASEKMFHQVKKHLESNTNIISFSKVRNLSIGKFYNFTNYVFKVSYICLRTLQRFMKNQFRR